MEPDGDAFWFQPPAALRRRRTQTAPLLNPVALILAIPILALLVLFFALPPFLAHTNQILRPNSVKKGWDSVNVVLVLFAILCGVFARRNDEAPPSEEVVVAAERRIPATDSTVSNLVNRPRESVPEWMDFPDRREYSSISSGGRAGGGLRRNSSSYPDLRQESVWENEGGNRSRFFDDFEVNFYRSPALENFELRRRRSHEAEAQPQVAEAVVREIQVDKFEVSSVPSPPRPAAPLPESSTPPPPPPPPPTLKRRRAVRSVPRAEIVDTRKDKAEVRQHHRQPPPPAPPPPPSPPPPPAAAEEEVPPPEEVSVKIHRRKSGTKEFATAITSLYKGQRKRKKRGKSRNIYENAGEDSSPPSAAEPPSAPPPPPPPPPPPRPPPPPPPPPPSKVLQNLFKKSSKSKRVHSVPTAAAPPPAPPPPPPPNSIFNNLFKTGNRSKRFVQSSAAPPAPPPPPPPPSSILNTLFKTGSKSRRHKNVTTSPPPSPPPPPPPPPPRPVEPPRRRHTNTGKPPKPTKPAEHYHESATVAPPSPLIPLPPPPPPFRMPAVRFVAQGDFVRIRSTHNSSRGSSPELEDDDDVASVKSEDPIGPSISCPSPDVNAKADSFIARLRDEWRLEKMNSAREKRIPG